MTLGERIRARRQEIGISADELGRRIGKDRATVYRYENGDIADIPVSMIPTIADALSIHPSELVPWADTKNGQATDDLTSELVKLFSQLNPNQQAYILGQTKALADNQ